MVKIDDVELVDMKTFVKFKEEIQDEIEKLRLSVNPTFRKELKKFGKETTSIERLKGKKEESPIEELMK